MEVTILGNNSALPANGRHPTAQLVKSNTHQILIDCGEGTQIQFSKYKLKQSKLDYILISHLHGDHFFGLPGLFTSLNLLGHSHEIQVFGPPKLSQVLETIFEAGKIRLRYPVHIHALIPNETQQIVNEDLLEITSFPVSHRIPTWGYKITEKVVLHNILTEAIEEFNLDFNEIKALKKGETITNRKGITVTPDMATKPLPPPRSYAFCSDTGYDPDIVKYFQQVNLLYHESMFMEAHRKKAQETMHCTSAQAANIAKMANAGRLLLGHYSSRYDDLLPLLWEAQSVFPNSILSLEGETYKV